MTSTNKLHNIFFISGGIPKLSGGNNTINKFLFLSDGFTSSINFMDNSTNVIDVSQLTNDVVKVQEDSDIRFIKRYGADVISNPPHNKDMVLIDVKLLLNYSLNSDLMIVHPKLHYIGRKHKVDIISCKICPMSVDRIFIDSGGGSSNDRKDLIENCNKAFVQPFTEVKGGNNTYILYVKTEGYENQDSSSTINVHGNGTIIFPEISLLKDCDQITYSPVNNTISFRIPLSQNGTFALDVKNYLDRKNNTNFALIDKYGSNIVPKLDNNSTVVNRFELHARHSLNNFNIAKDYYREVSHIEKDYQVFGVISSASQNNHKDTYKMFIGSSGTDVINFDKQTVFAEGGEGQDVYIASNTPGENTVTIDNRSEDKKFDILSVQSIDDVSLEQEGDDLTLFIEKRVNNTTEIDDVIIENYFLDYEYKHLILVDKNRNSFIPFELNKDVILVPFYRASSDENVFMLPVSVKQAIIDSNLENIEFYRDSNDLLLLEKDISENPHPLAVILQDFYSNLSQWENNKIYSRNHNGDYDNYIDLLQKSREAIDYKTYKYESVVKEYIVDFSKSIEIYHNQSQNRNGTITAFKPDEEKIGVMMLRNISPKQIKVYRNGSDLVLNDKNSNRTVSMKNWYISNSYKISTLKFDLDLNSIKIHQLDRDDSSDSDYLKSKVYYASLLSSNKIFLLGADVEHNLRCVVSTSSIDIPEAYIALGFTSFQDQVSFLQNCDLKEFELTELKNRINDLLPEYKNKLLYDLELSSYEQKKIDYYKHLIQDQLFNNTDRIIQVMKDIHNPVKDFRFENGTYNVTLSDVEYYTVIDFRPLSQQIKKNLYQELQFRISEYGRDLFIKLFYYKDEGSIRMNSEEEITQYIPAINSLVKVKLENIFQNDWYKNLHILLNDNTSMRINYDSSIGVSLVSVSEDFHSYRKSIIVTESGIEWQVGLTNEEMLLKSVRSKIGNSDEYQRSRRAVNIEDNQEQLSSFHNSDFAQPMSSSASRLEFWPMKLVKDIWSIAIDAVDYRSFNYLEKVMQSSPDIYRDKSRLNTNTKFYLNDISNTESRHNYEVPNNNHEHSTLPSSTENQEVNCVPYVWDADGQGYTTNTMSCTLTHGEAKIFSNIHQGSDSIQIEGYSIQGDSYKNCRTVEFYGRPSAYCEGNHTNLVYTPNIIPPSLDQINAQLMLARTFGIDKLIEKLVTRAKVLLGLEELHVAKEENTHLNSDIIEITSQQRNEWQVSIKNIENLLKTLSSEVNEKDIRWAKNIFEDRIEEIDKLSQQSTVNTEIITELKENLKVLQTELEESIECVYDTGRQRQEFQQADSQQCNSRYSAHAHLVHCMSALHVDNNIGYCSTTNLNHVIEQYPQIVSNYT